jgi:hypothetical protein
VSWECIQPILRHIDAGKTQAAKWETACFFLMELSLVSGEVAQDLEDKWRRSERFEDREQVIGECRRAIIAAEANHVAMRIKGMRGSPVWKAAIAFDNRPVRRVAEEYGVSKSTVARLRQAFGLKPRGRGRPVGGALPEIPPLHLL